MKQVLRLALIAALGLFTIGCDNQKGMTENKTETKTTETRDGKTTGEMTTTVDTKTTTTAAPPNGSGAPSKKSTETTR